MNIKACNLCGKDLDYWVMKALGYDNEWSIPDEIRGEWYAGESDGGAKEWQPSNDWHQGGSIIENESIGIGRRTSVKREWSAWIDSSFSETSSYYEYFAETPLVAAMRAYVASKFGYEFEEK